MKQSAFIVSLLLMLSGMTTAAEEPLASSTIGVIEGRNISGISAFLGIPFAVPPVGELRWRAPQPVQAWDGVRPAQGFAARCMQLPVFGDMNFRSNGMSEDCLYLNVWTPVSSADAGLPVLVYFYGGGFVAGDGSEPRYDGESMARRGIVSVTVNYRLGVFGFFSHPDLSREASYDGSGNYGLLDQIAALRWVQENIRAFGGDPSQVTIAGESAGSASVSGQMISPLSQGLFARAIGESGSFLGALRAQPLDDAETIGKEFAEHLGAADLNALRKMPAQTLLNATSKTGPDNVNYGSLFNFPPTIDGYFLPREPENIYASGEVSDVPLLYGWNSEEMTYLALFRDQPVTAGNYSAILEARFGPLAGKAAELYSGDSPEAIAQAASDLAGDGFIGYSTWKWGEAHSLVSDKPIYRYYYSRPRPVMRPEFTNAVPGLAGGIHEGTNEPPPAPLYKGAVHSAEIEYALGNLPTNRVYDWQPEDYRASTVMQGFFENFIRSGDPNGPGLPDWPALNSRADRPVMIIDAESRAEPARHRERYLFLDSLESPD